MIETALVTVLTSVGMKLRRAQAFERMLDDKSPYGISGDVLADLILKYAARDRAQFELFAKRIRNGNDVTGYKMLVDAATTR